MSDNVLPTNGSNDLSYREETADMVDRVMRMKYLVAVDAGAARNVRGELISIGFRDRIRPTTLANGKEAFDVPSETTPGVWYIVFFDEDEGKWVCFCLDYEDRHRDCKHIVSVANLFYPELAPKVTETMRAAVAKKRPYVGVKRLPHIPMKYESGLAESTRKDHALMRQPERVRQLLEDLSATLNRKYNKKKRSRGGQPMLPGDRVLAMVWRAHVRVALRPFSCNMRQLRELGSIRKTRCKSTLIKYQKGSDTTLLLMEAYRIVISALRNLETTFIIDGTGFSPMYVSNFCEMKHGDGDVRPGTQWLNLHAMIGQKSKAIVGFVLTPSSGDGNGELSQFNGFMEWLSTNDFNNREYVIADNLYLKRPCIQSAIAHGLTLVCPTKSGDFDQTSGEIRGYAREVGDFMQANPKAYDWLCRARSAIEGVFSVIKRSDNHIAAIGTADERANRDLKGVYTSRVNEMLTRVIEQVLCRIDEIELLSDERVSFIEDVPFTSKFKSEIGWGVDA